MQKILDNFFSEKLAPIINNTAIIDSSVKLGKNIFIGHNVVIEKNCCIGDNSVIDHNTVIKKETIIGSRVKIGANCTIGGTGFGYEKDELGNYQLIPHIGNVIISDNVEIGNSTTIDRAVLGSTFIGQNSKIDNLVHIAHGVQIGTNSLIIANSMIAGSSHVGNNVWISPSSSIIDHIKIGHNTLIGIGAVVLKDVLDNQRVVGNPAKLLEKKKGINLD